VRQIVWSKTFLKAYKRAKQRYPDFETDIEHILRVLAEDPFAPRLKTHKLKGKLKGTWACSVGHDLRLIFDFVKGAGKEDDVFLIEVGTHEEVY
jgi:addiction module RelE/StbE family toxin